MQIVLAETALCENHLNASWQIWVFWMRSGIYHGLVDFAAILYKPGICKPTVTYLFPYLDFRAQLSGISLSSRPRSS